MKQRLNIAVIDSGAGGLSILNEIIARRLNCDLTYISDAEKFPYGLLDEKTLCARITCIVEALLAQHRIDACIVACNSASTLVLPELRQRWHLPFIGVVPAIKPASQLTKTGVVGILATPGTVSRPYLDQLIIEFAASKVVHKYGSNTLVHLAENFIRNNVLDKEQVENELFNLISMDARMDTIVLACTHFPLLKAFLDNAVTGKNIRLLDSTDAIVNRLQTLLPSIKPASNEDGTAYNPRCEFLNTLEKDAPDYSHFVREAHRSLSLETFKASLHLGGQP